MTDGFGVLNVFQGLQIREKFTDIEEIMYENANIWILQIQNRESRHTCSITARLYRPKEWRKES